VSAEVHTRNQTLMANIFAHTAAKQPLRSSSEESNRRCAVSTRKYLPERHCGALRPYITAGTRARDRVSALMHVVRTLDSTVCQSLSLQCYCRLPSKRDTQSHNRAKREARLWLVRYYFSPSGRGRNIVISMYVCLSARVTRSWPHNRASCDYGVCIALRARDTDAQSNCPIIII